MNVTTYESDKFKLKRLSESAYYILVIQEMEGRYYIVKRSGKMGSPFTRAPFFRGWPLGEKSGYESLDLAFGEAEKIINVKLSQKAERKYVRLREDEDLVIENGGIKLKVRELA